MDEPGKEELVRCLEDERSNARSIILRRRAHFMALALAAVHSGAACGGETDGEGMGGSAGNAVVGGSTQQQGGSPGLAGEEPCLSYGGVPPEGGAGGAPENYGGGVGLGLSGAGGLQVCLTPPK